MFQRELIDDAVTDIRRRRSLARMGDQIHTRAFWRTLNPELTVGDGPIPAHSGDLALDDGRRDRALAQLREEGYCLIPSRFGPAEIDPLRRAVARIEDAGLPAIFVWVYDEIFALFARACRALEPVLGSRPWFVPDEFWAFHVVPDDSAATRWSAFGPHRDWLCADPGVLARELPTVLTIWIPLVDVTTLDSCIYVVPSPGDSNYFANENIKDQRSFRLQDIRALPAAAGSILAWTTHLVHWGSRSSPYATSPRVSVTAYFQRRDVPRYGAEVVELDGPIPFESRVRWIYKALTEAGPLGRSEQARS